MIFSYTGCRLSSAPTLNSHGYKCIKPQSNIQYLEHKREFGEPDLCLLNQTTILPWFTSEFDDSNTKIGQLVCLEKLFQNYGIYWIDNRRLIYVRVWWLRSDDCSALFNSLSMSLVCQPSMLFHPLPFAYRHALGIMHDHSYPHPVLIHDSSGSCIYCFAALQAMVSWADTFNGHSLTSVRSDRGGIIYWTTTTLVSLTILPFFRPSVSLGVAHQPHIFSHPTHLQRSYGEVHLNSTSW